MMDAAIATPAAERNGHRAPAAGAEPFIGRQPSGHGVQSEVGTLRRAILHRPGYEICRLGLARNVRLPAECVPRVRRARAEHDALADALARRGVEILYLNDLLVDTLEDPRARGQVIERSLGFAKLAPRSRSTLATWLASLDSLELAARLVGGVMAHELPLTGRSRSAAASGNGFVLSPLPTQLLTRAASAWIYGGVAVNAAANPDRRRESILVDAIYVHHPSFASPGHESWNAGLAGPARLDGDDVFVLGNGSVLIGAGGESTRISAALLASRLFDAAAARRVIVASLPGTPHHATLDTVMTMVDRDAFVIRPELGDGLAVHSLRPGDGTLAVQREPDLFAALADALGLESPRLFEVRGTPLEGGGRSRGTDVLAIAPGAVIGYDHEVETNAALRKAGIEVVAVAGSELARAGGPRSLVCPIERDPVPTP